MCHNGAQNGALAGAATAGWCREREREVIVDLPVERRGVVLTEVFQWYFKK
jgi:hypothetical protein